MHGKRLVSSSPRDWQAARQVWSHQSREVCEIRMLFIGRCGYQEGKGVDKKEARGGVMQETGSACCNCEEGLALQCRPGRWSALPYRGGSRRVTLEKSLNCGVNYLL